MNRTIYQSQSQVRTFDLQANEVDALISVSSAVQDILGGTTTMLTGFAATPTGPASLNINLASGRIYQIAPIDATADGAIPQNLTNILQQGYIGAQAISLSTSGIGAGQSRWSLIEAQFSQVDAVRANDPTGGLLLFYNSTNPNMPYEGPGNDGLTSNTVREGVVTLQVITGSSATTGSEVPPNPTSGWVPLYLIDLSSTQTAITSGEILTAGPSVGTNVPSNYPQAPFLAGLLNQHHLGITGSAPQIDLTAEVKNLLPLTHLPASSTNSGTGIPVLQLYAGNPNTHIAGNANVNGTSDLCWDTVDGTLFICTTTGNASAAVWTSVTQGTSSSFNGGNTTGGTGTPNAYVIGSTSPGGFSLTPGVTVTAIINVNNTGASTLNVDSLGAKAIVKASGSGPVALTGGELVAGNSAIFNYLGSAGFEIVATGLGSAAYKTASGTGANVASVSGTITAGHTPVFADTNGTVSDSGGVALLAGNNLSDVPSAATARGSISAAKSGINSDITGIFGFAHTEITETSGNLAEIANNNGLQINNVAGNAYAPVFCANGALSNQAVTYDQFAASLSSTGYQRLPSGFIVQWGSVTTTGGGVISVTFPLTFPNGVFVVTLGLVSTSPINAYTAYSNLTNAGMNVFTNAAGGGTQLGTVSYIALGH